MSTSIENHVVRMEFENKSFEKNASQTMDTVQKLKENLKFDGAASGLDELGKAVKNVDTSGLSKGVEEASKKFSTLEVIGITALVRLTNAAIDVGKKIASALTAPLNQIKSGGWSRAMNLEQAKFQLKGMKMDVEAVMKDVDYAVSGTAYSLDAAAKAAATLGASGVKAGDQVGGLARALRAVSGVAAMTNSDYESIADIFSTVAGNGKLMTMQLRQLSSRGMNAAATLAKAMNTSEAAIYEMVQKGKISFADFSEAMFEAFGEHAVAANETFTGSLSNIKSALSRVGETFATPIIQQAIPVFNALRVSINEVNKEVKKIWGNFTRFGTDISGPFERLAYTVSQHLTKYLSSDNFVEAWKSIVRGLSNIFLGLIDIFTNVREAWREIFPSEVAEKTRKVGGAFERFTEIVVNLVHKAMPPFKEGLKIIFNLLKILGSVLSGIFNVLKPVLGIGLYILNLMFQAIDYIGKFINEAFKAVDVTKIINGLFSVLSTIISIAAMAILKLIDALVAFNKRFPIFDYIAKGIYAVAGAIGYLVSGIITLFKTPIEEWPKLFSGLIGKVKELFSEFTKLPIVQKIISGIKTVAEALAPIFEKIISTIKSFGLAVGNFFVNLFDKIKNGGIADALKFIRDKFIEIKNTIGGVLNKGFTAIFGKEIQETTKGFGGILGGVVQKIREFATSLDIGRIAALGFTGAMVAIFVGIAKSIFAFGGFIKSLTGLTGAIKGLFTGAIRQDRPIVSAAKAILFFAGALYLLSQVDVSKLPAIAAVLGGILVVATGIIVLMGIFGKIKSLAASARAMMASFLGFSLSVGILTGSIVLLLTVLNEDNAQHLWTAVNVMLTTMVALGAIATLMSKFAPRLFSGGLGLLLYAIAINMIIKKLANIDWSKLKDLGVEMGVAFAGLAVAGHQLTPLLTSLANFARGLGTAAAGIAIAIAILARTANYIQNQDWDIGKAIGALSFIGVLIAIFGAITILNNKFAGGDKKGLAAYSMPLTILAIAASVAALSVLASVIGYLPGNKLKKGLIVVGGLLALLGGVIILINLTSKNVTKESTTTVIALVVGLVLLSGELAVLSLIDWKALLVAAGSLALVILSLGYVIKQLTKIKANKFAKTVPYIVTALVALTGVVIAMKVLASTDWRSILAAGIGIGVVLLAFGKSIELMNDNSFKKAKSGVIIGLLGSIIVMAGAMWLVSTQPWEGIAASGIAMSLAIMAFGKATSYINSMTFKKSTFTTFAGIALSMVAIGFALRLASKNDWQSILAAGGAMSLAILAFAAAIRIINAQSFKKNSLEILFGMSLAMVALGGGLALASMAPWEQILAAAISMSAVLMVFVGALKLIEMIAPSLESLLALAAIGGSAILVGIALGYIADGLIQFAGVPWESLGKAGASIAVISILLGVLSGFSKLAGLDFLITAASFVVLGAAFGIIADGLSSFENIGWGTLGKAAATIIVLAIALGVLSSLTGMGIGAVIVAAALVITGIALEKLGHSLGVFEQEAGWGAIGQLAVLALSLLLLGAAGIVAGLGVLGLMGAAEAVTMHAKACEEYAPYEDVSYFDLAIGIMLLGAAGMVAIGGVSGLMGVGEAVLLHGVACSIYAPYEDVSYSRLAGGIKELGKAGKSIDQAALAGLMLLSEVLLQLINTMVMAPPILDTSIMSLTMQLTMAATILPLLVVKMCNDMASGLVKGLANVAKISYISAKNIGDNIVEGFRDGAQWHSTPHFITDFFSDLGEGLLSGAENIGLEIPPVITDAFHNGITIPAVDEMLNCTNICSDLLGGIMNMEGVAYTKTEKIRRWYKEMSDITNPNGWDSTQLANLRGFKQMAAKEFDEIAYMLDGVTEAEIKKIRTDHIENYAAERMAELYWEDTEAGNELLDTTDLLTDSMGDLSKSVGGATASIEEQKDALTEFVEATRDAIKNGISIFDEFDKKTELTGKKLLENMRSQVSGVKEWANNLRLLAERGISQGLLSELAQLGPQGYEKVAAFTQMTQEELAEANALFAESLALPDALAAQLGGSWALAGEYMNQGLALGLANSGEANAAVGTLSENLLARFNAAWGIASPSAVMAEEGLYLILGLAQGLYNNVNELQRPLNFIERAISTQALIIGMEFDKGLERGINSGLGGVVNAARRVATEALEAAKSALSIQSPSRAAMEIGRYFDLGFAIGLDKYSSASTDAAVNVGNNAMLGIRSALNAFDDYINGEGPTIRPILDLSGVMEEAKKLDTTFNTRAKLGLDGGVDENGNSLYGHGVVNNFTQNNYSPKALSRLDIYRQTNNLISRSRTAGA